MEDYKKIITELIEKREKNDQTIEEQIRYLGERLAELEPSKLDKTSLKDPQQQVKDLATISVEDRKKIKQIDSLISQIEEINSEVNKHKTQIRNKKTEVRTHYEELGFAAYKAFKENRKKGEAYKELFTKTEGYETELSQIENELNEHKVKEEKKSPLYRIYERGRLFYLQGLLKVKHFRQSALYRDVGEKVFKSDFLTEIGDASLTSNMKPVFEAQEIVDRLLKKEESLFEKKRRLTEEIERLGGKVGTTRTTKEIEINVERTEKQLVNLYSTLGRIYIDDSLNKEISGGEIDRIFKNIHSLTNENQNFNRQIRKLEAAIEINQIEKNIDDVRDRIDYLKNDIQKKEDEIESLTRSIAELEEEKKKQLKLRGSNDSLITKRPLEVSNAKES